jgi:hypothetical protein
MEIQYPDMGCPERELVWVNICVGIVPKMVEMLGIYMK